MQGIKRAAEATCGFNRLHLQSRTGLPPEKLRMVASTEITETLSAFQIDPAGIV
jgi:hypothetical protein